MTEFSKTSQLPSEVSGRTTFDTILYAQCWEDADVLLQGLDVQPGDVCLSIASAGDNTLALLTRDPRKVIAVDLSAAQLACLEIRVAAIRTLRHDEFLELMGSRASTRRETLYHKCRPELQSNYARELWDGLQPQWVRHGVGGVGKFETYWRMFRCYVLPLIHRRSDVTKLLTRKSAHDRQVFFEECWNNWRWRTLARAFGSQRVLSWIGRDPAFFAYVEDSTAKDVMQRAKHALTDLSPAENPFIHWILTGQHGTALPLAYQPENFEIIRNNLARLQWNQCSIEDMAADCVAADQRIDKFNLSDIFEYMSVENQRVALQALLAASRSGSRMLFWNMMVPRPIPYELSDRIVPLEDLATELHGRDKGFFYGDLKIAEVR